MKTGGFFKVHEDTLALVNNGLPFPFFKVKEKREPRGLFKKGPGLLIPVSIASKS